MLHSEIVSQRRKTTKQTNKQKKRQCLGLALSINAEYLYSNDFLKYIFNLACKGTAFHMAFHISLGYLPATFPFTPHPC